jgi:hypothetical protein
VADELFKSGENGARRFDSPGTAGMENFQINSNEIIRNSSDEANIPAGADSASHKNEKLSLADARGGEIAGIFSPASRRKVGRQNGNVYSQSA